MEKMSPPQQLDLPLESITSLLTEARGVSVTSSKLNGDGLHKRESKLATMIDFNAALSRQKSSDSSNLYRQIINSVRHIA